MLTCLSDAIDLFHPYKKLIFNCKRNIQINHEFRQFWLILSDVKFVASEQLQKNCVHNEQKCECTHTTDATSHDRLNGIQFSFYFFIFLFTVYTIAWHAIVAIEWSFWPKSSENKRRRNIIGKKFHSLSVRWEDVHFPSDIQYRCIDSSLIRDFRQSSQIVRSFHLLAAFIECTILRPAQFIVQ